MILADCGTSYTKILDSKIDKLTIVETRKLFQNTPVSFDAATGHAGRFRTEFYVNELVCLAIGASAIVGSDDFCIVDVGGRDIKLVEYVEGKPRRLDWNMSCGANTGFTLEILGKYYDIDYSTLEPDKEHFDITCGVFGIEKVFDAIIEGIPEDRAVARFVHGVARNIHRFTEKKEKFYFSGGLTENACFMSTLSKYADVVSLGRTVLLTGLKESVREGQLHDDVQVPNV
jgi:activator of 2-hydroxyglutaryl-CoA dehydratase